MKIKTLHAHFLISTSSSSNERIGFVVELDEGESIESTVETLRERAKKIVGKKAQDLYNERYELTKECKELENKLNALRKEWDATADFLKAQGLNPTAPSMPQFRNLLAAVTVETEVIREEDSDDDNDDYDEDDEDE